MSVLVIGGGISGLACAYRLNQRGVDVQVIEKENRVGGVVQSEEVAGFQFDLGPQSFLSNDTILRLISELGLDSEMLRANPRAPRFIYFNSRLQPAPMSPPALLKTPLLSGRTKRRILIEPLRKSRPPEADESVAAFARRKFGEDLLDNLLGPFVSGVYAGDPERLSLRSAFPSAHRWELEHGSVIRGAMKARPEKGWPRPVLTSFRGGLQTLMRSLASSLAGRIETGVEVCGLRPITDSEFEVHIRGREGSLERSKGAAVVLATPAYVSSRLLGEISPSAAEALRRIEYAPVAVVNLGYRREQVAHPLEGFGFLAPRTQGLRILGTIWGSSLFTGRAPQGMVSLTSFLGGATDPALFDLSDDAIAQLAAAENARVLGITGVPVVHRLQRFTHAIPQYNLGHDGILARIRAALASHPGLFLTGNYFQGPSIATCVETAFATADQICKTLT
ncbi:MAG: protoporphyrinogen oxidase [Candidatus Acidiferrales bacterium]